jgi:hypothetical protein
MLAIFDALACKRREAEFRPEIAIPMVFSMVSYYHIVVNMIFMVLVIPQMISENALILDPILLFQWYFF